MTRLVNDARILAIRPVSRAPAPRRRADRARRAGWWPTVVVAAGALTGAGVGYRVGRRLDHERVAVEAGT